MTENKNNKDVLAWLEIEHDVDLSTLDDEAIAFAREVGISGIQESIRSRIVEAINTELKLIRIDQTGVKDSLKWTKQDAKIVPGQKPPTWLKDKSEDIKKILFPDS